MTTTVHLNVGMPKCASSALQSLLHRNNERHRAEGLMLPAWGKVLIYEIMDRNEITLSQAYALKYRLAENTCKKE